MANSGTVRKKTPDSEKTGLPFKLSYGNAAPEDIHERKCMLGALLCSIVGLLWISCYNYLLFHSFAEIYSVAVCWGVFFVSWSAHRLVKNNYLCVLGVASLFIGFLLLLHMLAYKGMGVFPQAGADLSGQLWVAARYLYALAFASASASLFLSRRKISTMLPAFVWGLLTLLFLVLIFTGRFPTCFIDGVGLTTFKKNSEIITIVFFALAALLTWIKQDKMDRRVLRMLFIALLLTMAAGCMFIFYVHVDSTPNLFGHCFNIGSAYCVFRAFIRTGITTPQTLLFYELNRRQQQLEKIKKTLEQQVNERTKKLNLRNRELEESNLRLDEFAYSVSHDLREPLRGMHNFAHFLAEDYSDTIDAAGREMLDTIMRLAKRLDAQILAILKYSRIGRLDLELQSTDLDSLLDEVLDSLGERICANNVRIERPTPLPRVVCHADYVMDVLHNLISNGIIYNDSPEKTITAGWYAPEKYPVDVEKIFPAPCGNVPIFYVHDNGIGIHEKHFQKIFGIFRRLHGQNKYGGGTGVGLTIARQVIERHGGIIMPQSEPGRGTTFSFTLSVGEKA